MAHRYPIWAGTLSILGLAFAALFLVPADDPISLGLVWMAQWAVGLLFGLVVLGLALDILSARKNIKGEAKRGND
jgi:hypothetical protein